MLYAPTIWLIITGLALMLVGGLTVWAYGARRRGEPLVLTSSGPESIATHLFHLKAVRWFRAYGITLTGLGALMLLWLVT